MTSLLQDDVEWTPEARTSSSLTIDEESDRLNALVGNLLDMSRLQTGALDVDCSAGRSRRGDPGRAREHRRARRRRRCRRRRDPAPRARRPGPARAGARERDRATPSTTARPASRCASSPARPATPSTCASSIAARACRPAIARPSFCPFQRLGDAGGGDGVGLGLAVAKGFVEAIGGDVEIEDTPGGGLTMVFRLRAAT